MLARQGARHCGALGLPGRSAWAERSEQCVTALGKAWDKLMVPAVHGRPDRSLIDPFLKVNAEAAKREMLSLIEPANRVGVCGR